MAKKSEKYVKSIKIVSKWKALRNLKEMCTRFTVLSFYVFRDRLPFFVIISYIVCVISDCWHIFYSGRWLFFFETVAMFSRKENAFTEDNWKRNAETFSFFTENKKIATEKIVKSILYGIFPSQTETLLYESRAILRWNETHTQAKGKNEEKKKKIRKIS